MAFIRKKVTDGRIYYYIVENKLIKGKVQQKVIMYLGTADSVLEKFKKLKKKA